MGILFRITAFSALLAAAVTAAPVDEDKPHGRVCVSVVEPGTPEREQQLRPDAAPGAGKKVNVYVDASGKCSALVVAMRKDGKLAYGWRPQFIEVTEEFDEVQLPKKPAVWEWKEAGEPFEIYALFLAPGAPDAAELKKLVAAMQNPSLDERLLGMQTNKLHEILGRITSDPARNQVAASDPEVGGVFRGAAFPWRQFAQAVNFDSGKPGVVVIPGPAGPAPKGGS